MLIMTSIHPIITAPVPRIAQPSDLPISCSIMVRNPNTKHNKDVLFLLIIFFIIVNITIQTYLLIADAISRRVTVREVSC